jgi:hypothetical protein
MTGRSVSRMLSIKIVTAGHHEQNAMETGKPVSRSKLESPPPGCGQDACVGHPTGKTRNSLAAGESVLRLLSNIISSLPSAARTNVYLHYSNIPGYWERAVHCQSGKKTALVQRDKFVGVRAAQTIQRRSRSFCGRPVRGQGPREYLVSGERYAVAQNYMAPGSLTIEISNRALAAATNNWTTNTAGLLLETQANTEIAVHNNARPSSQSCCTTRVMISTGSPSDETWGAIGDR